MGAAPWSMPQMPGGWNTWMGGSQSPTMFQTNLPGLGSFPGGIAGGFMQPAGGLWSPISQGTAAGPGTTGMPGVPGFGQPVPPGPGDQSLPGGGGGFGSPLPTSQTNTPFTDQLTQMLQSGGNPINMTPAWQSMIDAQQRNIQEQAANLGEQFNVSGNRFSSAFGTGMTDFYNQAAKNQNALLGQMTAQAGESAAGRMYGAESQLSGQDFQSMMNQYNTSAMMAQLMNQNQMNAMQGMYQGQMGTVSPFLNYAAGMQGMDLSGGANLGNIINQTYGVGGGLAQQQYGQQQNAISNAYQEFLRTQPFNNPLVQMMQSAAFNYPQMITPGYQPGMLGSMMQGAGSIMGGLGMMGPGLGMLI